MSSTSVGNILTPISPESSGELQTDALVEEVLVVAENSAMSVTLNISAASLPTFTSSRIFAVIIGLNHYENPLYNLRGAVLDAERMKAYLGSLGVPTSRIKTLLNEEATRDAIIANLKELKTNPEICYGDPILVFYAGHGGTAKTPIGWDAGSDHIQVLLPHDFHYTSLKNPVHAIPDRTIGSLLEQIAVAKGDNITVVFDCCYSGGLARGVLESRPRGELESWPRGVDVEMHIPCDLDEDIWGKVSDVVKKDPEHHSSPDTNRGSYTPTRYLKRGLHSYVLVSACGEEEYARETSTGGIFTTHFLDALKAVGAHTVTYSQLIQRIPCQNKQGTVCSLECVMTSKQNPQCEGHNRRRICFNFNPQSQSNSMYVVCKVGQEYVMEAGAAHGITNGAIFALYTDPNPTPTQISVATLQALNPNAVTTILVPLPESARPDIKKQAFALLIKAGEDESFRIQVEPNETLKAILDEVAKEREKYHPTHPKIQVEKEKTELELAIDDGKLVFKYITDSPVWKQGLHRLYGITPLTLEDVRPVLYKAAHYFWHLRRTGNTKRLQRAVDIEFRRLEEVDEEDDDIFNPVRRPYGPNLIKDGVIDIVVEEEALYGIKIVNRSKTALYASLFYFDNSDLSITSYFQPGLSAGKVDPPLRPESSITIGYGNTGTVPLVYRLRKGQDVDVGYLKLFLSVNHVDLSDIPQDSPFEGHSKAAAKYKAKPVQLWSTVQITFVQRRGAST